MRSTTFGPALAKVLCEPGGKMSLLITRAIGYGTRAAAAMSVLLIACESEPDAPAEIAEDDSSGLNATPPDFPAIDRSDGVQAIDPNSAEKFTRPFLPSHRTTADGRVAFTQILGSKIWLNVPEKLTTPFSGGPPGTSILASDGAGRPRSLPLDKSKLAKAHPEGADEDKIGHVAVCDPTAQFPAAGDASNPTVCDGNHDCYHVKVVVPYHRRFGADWKTEIWATPVTVKVSNPKTANAQLVSITYDGPPVKGLSYDSIGFGQADAGPFLEPVFTNDGKLLVYRTGDRRMEWFGEDGTKYNGNRSKLYNVVYSVVPSGAAACDVTKLSDPRPIAYAPYDATMKGRYGLADYPLRDPEGNKIHVVYRDEP